MSSKHVSRASVVSTEDRVFADPDVITSRELRAYMSRSDGPALVRVAAIALLLVGTAALILHSPDRVWLLAAMLLHGFVLVHLFALLHECAHMTAFKTRRLNTIFGWVCGVAINLGPRYFQYEHTQHHTYTQAPGKDPQHIPLPTSVAAYVLYLSGLPYWYGQWKSLLTHAANRIPATELRFIATGIRQEIVNEARIILAIYVLVAVLAIAYGWRWPLYLWVLPLLLGEPAMRFIRMTEHVGRPHTPDLTRNTRTNHVSWPLRMLCWNMNFHAEHHFAPSVPFHALPDLNVRIGSRLTSTSGYGDAHRQVLRLINSDNSISVR